MKNSGVEWIGEIPAEWKIVKVKQAFYRKNEKAQQENPIVLSLARSGVKVRDISANEGQIAESYYNYNPVSIGDLLLNPMDLYSGANCSISKVEGVISPAYANLRSKEGYFSNFYDYYFKVQYWMMVLFAHGKGVSFDNRWTLTNETLMNFPVVAPSLDEQHRIADFLDEKCAKIDAVIEKQKQVVEKLKEYKLSVITEAVTKGLDPTVPMKDSGVEWIGEIPEGWKKIKLNNCCTFHNGDRSSNYPSPEDFSDIGIPFIGADGLNDFSKVNFLTAKKISLEKYGIMGGLKIKRGDILYTLRGSTIGKNSICNFDEGTVASSLMGIRIIENGELSSVFLSYILNSKIEFIQRDVCINGSTAPNLSAEDVKQFFVFLPSKKEQEDIIVFLDKKCHCIDSAINKKQSIVEKLTEYKKSLIYEVVTGKREV